MAFRRSIGPAAYTPDMVGDADPQGGNYSGPDVPQGPDAPYTPPMPGAPSGADTGMGEPAPPPPDVTARTPVEKGQSSESPRDREMTSAPRMPSVPTPQAGAASPAMDASSGVIPFAPMQGPSPISTVTPRSVSLFGGAGGLTGGGLGIPQDPTTRANSDSIEGLIQLLTKMQR